MPTATLALTRPTGEALWREPARYWPELTEATAHLETPLGAISATGLAANAFDMLDRAAGTPIRVASKSVRVRAVLDAVLALPGYHGVLAYTLPEALWLAETGIQDVVVGYPSVDRAALARLAIDEGLASRVTVMIDDVEQLDLIDAVTPPAKAQRRSGSASSSTPPSRPRCSGTSAFGAAPCTPPSRPAPSPRRSSPAPASRSSG